MKAGSKWNQKVSLLFYSEEEGKKTLIDKWTIEKGRKYTIGRSKKKVDISIQDITISRIHSEFIFYDKDKIMIKDFNSSNGTYINKQKIEPNKENYFSIREIVSIGDEKNELIFSVEKNEEETFNRNDFDNNLIENKNNKEEIKQNKFTRNKKNYIENENININLEETKKNKYSKNEKSKSFERDSSSNKSDDEKDKYLEKDENIKKYNKFDDDKYGYNKNRSKDYKYNDNSYKRKRYYNRSRSRSRSNSFKKQYNKKNIRHKKPKRNYSKHSRDDSSSSEKSSPKKILSYIIKQEEEIEKENDKKQIRLYNEYLKIKEETDAKSEMNKLPNLLPLLIAKFESEDSFSNDSDRKEKKDKIRLSPLYKRKIKSEIIRDDYKRKKINKYNSSYINRNRYRSKKRDN